MLVSKPKWMALAENEVGVKEAPGGDDNPVVVAYYRDAGHPEVEHDSVAWCAAFVGAMLKRSGVKPSGSLLARSYLGWGAPISAPKVGCIAVLWRGAPDADTGHVGFLLDELEDTVVLLGGNQSDAVTREAYPKSRVLGYRWPLEEVKMNTDAGTTISKTVTGTNLTAIIAGILVAALNMTTEGPIVLHIVSVIAGIVAAGAGAVNQLHLTGLTNANTIAQNIGDVALTVKNAIDSAETK